jgi:hypothetical protein
MLLISNVLILTQSNTFSIQSEPVLSMAFCVPWLLLVLFTEPRWARNFRGKHKLTHLEIAVSYYGDYLAQRWHPKHHKKFKFLLNCVARFIHYLGSFKTFTYSNAPVYIEIFAFIDIFCILDFSKVSFLTSFGILRLNS